MGVTNQTGVPADEQRLICNQCELQPGMTLDEQNIKTNSIATLLEQPEERVCPDWLATGRGHLKGCCLRATHTMQYSPRYLAHHIKLSSKQPVSAIQPQQLAPEAAPFIPQPILSTTSAPFTILQLPSSEPPMLSHSATPFMMIQERGSSASCSQAHSPPAFSPMAETFRPALPDTVNALSATAAPFVRTASWEGSSSDVPMLSIPPQQQHVGSPLACAQPEAPAIGTPLIQRGTSPRLVDSQPPASSSSPSARTSQRRSSLPWDCTQDAELVGEASVHRPVGSSDSSTMGSAWPSHQPAPSLQWGQINYEQGTKRGLKREAVSRQQSPRGDEMQRIRWAQTVR